MMYPFSVRVLASLLVALSALAVAPAWAQVTVSGRIVDADTEAPLPGANAVATHLAADSLFAGTAAGTDGAFALDLPPGTYRLRISFVGFTPDVRTITAEGDSIALGRIALRADPTALGETVVEALRERVSLRGDTTVYNADAFEVNPDASAEDLVAKMPGVVVQDGTVQAQGEDVRRVLVDGEEFFGDDATAALRNLPAEIIKEIEVYDRQSEQAQFTGFDDDSAEKTINIVTRDGMSNGQFGRVFGGYGPGTRYLAGGTVHAFDGARRISIIGLTNNINEQNFATEDLMGVLNAGNDRRGARGGRGQRGGGPGRGDAGNYLVGPQDGVNTTSSLGINYTDRWGETVRLNGSYFFNRSGNVTDALTDREYLVADGANTHYTEAYDAESTNDTHRLNLRLRADLSDATQLTLTPRLSVQTGTAQSLQTGLSTLADGAASSRLSNQYAADNLGYTSAVDLFVRHRFPTRGRTLSASIGLDLDERRSDSDQAVESLSFATDGLPADDAEAYRRRLGSDGGGRTFSTRIAFTEPLGERGQFQVNYAPSITTSTSEQDGFLFDEATGQYSIPDTAYTRRSDQRIVRQRGGLDYRYRREGFSASLGLDLQHEQIDYEQVGGRAFEVKRGDLSLLPSARLRFDLSEASNLRLNYRAGTDVPGVTQLRDVVDDTNPLYITRGNPDLQTSRSHRFDARFRTTRPTTGASFMGFLNVTTTQDYIGSAVVVAQADTVVTQGVTLAPGAQLSYPVNLDGYWSARSFATYGRPVGLLRSNLNASLGARYTRQPGLIDGIPNRADALSLDGRFFLGSNVSERLDFSLSYGLSYTTVANSAADVEDDAYLRHRGGLQLNALPWGGLVLTSDLDLSFYTGLASSVDPVQARWNVGVGYKFLRNDVAEVRLTVNDLLNRDTAVNRVVSGTYVEDRQTASLGRYMMLHLTYKLRNFGR